MAALFRLQEKIENIESMPKIDYLGVGRLFLLPTMTACNADYDSLSHVRMAEVPDMTRSIQPCNGKPCKVTLTGRRLTQGNAVDCPTIEDDNGQVHPVSYLSPAVAIGARVSVSGVHGITTTCLGIVLVVDTEQVIEDLP